MIRQTIVSTCVLWLVAAGLSAAVAAGLATSASKVDVSAEYIHAGEDAPRIRVQLAIADGWHVNANPASLDFLVPTTIDADAGTLDIDWPDGHDSDIELGGTSIQVYSGNTTIPVRLDAAAAESVTLRVRVQACSDSGLCLPPSTLSVKPVAS